MQVYDVAIIGAGPSGSSAAYYCAKAGLSTIILEEHSEVGKPVHCGECLSSIAAERMSLGIPSEAIAKKVKGVRVYFPDKSTTLLREEGYVLHKELFEQYLVVRAQGEGAILRTSAKVKGMERKNNLWALSTLAGEISAKAVIDASGVASVASHLTGLNQAKFQAGGLAKKMFKTVVGLQYTLEDVPNDGFLEFFLWPRLAPEGYLWIIPKQAGSANVGLVTSQTPKAKQLLDQFVKEWGLGGKKSIRTFGGPIPASGPLEHTVGNALLLVGDAAGFTSPMFEGGTQLGMVSGKLAAQTLCRAFKSGNLSQSFLSQYVSSWKNEFPPYKKLLEGKERMYAFSDQELNFISSALPSDLTGINWVGKAGVGAKLLANPSLILKGVAKALETFSYSTAEKYGW